MSYLTETVLGQERTVSHLNNLCQSNRIPHALLFTGPKGVGKHLTAIQFAKQLNSMEGALSPSVEKKINNLEEPYIKFIQALPRGRSETGNDLPTAKLDNDQIKNLTEQLDSLIGNPYHDINLDKAQNIKISSIRDLRKFLALGFDEVKFRVVIIHEAHKMSLDSQNAILKSLEEPPENVIIILHSSNPDLLLSTIKSRCQEIKFNPLSAESIVKILVKYFHCSNDSSMLVSRFADGSVVKAKSLIDDDLESFLENCINILRYSLARKYQTAFEYFGNITDKWGNDGFYIVLDFIVKWFLDVIRNRSDIEMEYFANHKDTIIKFNQRYGDFELTELVNKLEFLNSAKQKNINLNICISNVIFQIGRIGIG